MDIIMLGTAPLIEKAEKLLSCFGTFHTVAVFELGTSGVGTKVATSEAAAWVKQMHDKVPGASLLLAVPNLSAGKITAGLKNTGITNVFFLPEYAYDLMLPGLGNNFMVPVDLTKPRLDYLEFQVCDHCNLNCKGCTHYCNISEEVFADLDSYTRDLKRIKELFWGIARIRLMGGEPLLNKDLPRFIAVTRQVFPDAEIRVVTNGLLIPAMTKELAGAMNNNHCGFDITLYQPTAHILEIITKVLDGYAINRNISRRITKFIRFKTLGPVNNPEKSSKVCRPRRCHFLRNGCLAKCSEPILAEKLNHRYLTNYFSQDIHNIYDKDIDAWELRKQLDAPMDFCKYCVPYPDKFDWQRCDASTAQLEDWLVPSWKIPFLNLMYFPRVITRNAFMKVVGPMPGVAAAVKKLQNR
jgi:hypothetical protein